MLRRSRLLCTVLVLTLGLPALRALAQPAPDSQPSAPTDAVPTPAPPPTASPVTTPALPAPAKPALPPPVELNPEELAELEAVEVATTRYESASKTHDRRLKAILRREYTQRLRALEARYEKSQKIADEQYRAKHGDAIKRLEEFLKNYPDDPHWSPDAMFRLAELYLDQAGLDYDEKLKRQAQGNGDAPPPADEGGDEEFAFEASGAYDGPDYTRSLDLWRRVVKNFPSYRQIDGSLYLLGYYLGEMGRGAEAKSAYLGLTCHNKFNPLEVPPDTSAPPEPGLPKPPLPDDDPNFVNPYDDCVPVKEGSGLLDEAWVRIGEVHFDTRGELLLAIASYKKVASQKNSEFYDESLYKLAWSYYRHDQFMEGINAFDELVVWSDKQEEAGEEKSDLRNEAVQYIAISFADPWEKAAQMDPVKSLERISAYYKGRTTEKHVRDIYEQFGDTIRASGGGPQSGEVPANVLEVFDTAIAGWQYCLKYWPLHPRNPVLHQKIIDAMADKGDPLAAMEERRRLAEAYKRGTDWFAANETNREAMETASKLGEKSLIAAAQSTHRNAQKAKTEWEGAKTPEGKTQYIAQYKLAAELYQQYLNEFPTSPEVYELTYRLADCYFFSEQYVESVRHYRWVRDHKELGEKYFEPAALSIVQAFQEGVAQSKAAGQLVEPPLPTAEVLKQSSAPIDIPELYANLQTAYDEYMVLVHDEKTAPKMALASAMISYRHQQSDDALRRFDVVLKQFCKSPEAVQAKDGLLVMYESRGDDKKFQDVNDLFIDSKCGEDKDIEIAKRQNMTKSYEVATKLYKDNKFPEAGAAFYAIYKTSPDDDENRDDELFSAAIAFEKAGKPKTAIAIYQEFSKVAQFKKSEYFVESLYRTAVSYQNAFDYESAVDVYLQVAALAAEPGRRAREGFDLQKTRLDAMWNAAFLREMDRIYYDRGKNDPGAATLYRNYSAADTTDRQRSRDAFFRTAMVYEKAGDTKNMMKTFAEWRKSFGYDEGAGYFVVLSQHKTAKALESQRDKKGAEKYYRATIKAFDETKEAPGSPSAELAGESQFWLAEKTYAAVFEPYKVKWKGSLTGKNAEKVVTDTLDSLQKVAVDSAAAYLAVARFESSWSLAASVRLGDVAFFAGQKLLEAPVPKEILDADAQFPDQGVLASYQQQLEDQTKPQTEDGKNFWTKAVDSAKNAGVSNQWSKLAQQRLNAYIASDLYPVQRDELIDREMNP